MSDKNPMVFSAIAITGEGITVSVADIERLPGKTITVGMRALQALVFASELHAMADGMAQYARLKLGALKPEDYRWSLGERAALADDKGYGEGKVVAVDNGRVRLQFLSGGMMWFSAAELRKE